MILLVGKIIEFLATVGDHNPSVTIILICTLKNHNLLLFHFFCNLLWKHLESILGIIKNIWLWISENIALTTNLRNEILLWTIFRKWFSKLQQHERRFRGWVFIVFLYSQKTTKTCKKGTLFLWTMCVMITQPIGPLDAYRSVSTFSCNVLQVLCFWLCTTMG